MTTDSPAPAAAAPAAVAEKQLAAEIASLEIAEDPSSDQQEQNKEEQMQVPPHRSHDPKNNQKRSDPFQFGSRYLTEEDDVFEFNAWDHVETDDAYKAYAEQQYAMQRAAPVSEFDKRKCESSFLSSPFAGILPGACDDLQK
jgi:hypothetical protein